MVEIAHFQTPLAAALMSGKGTDVIKVNVCTCNIFCNKCGELGICGDGFCQNGGECLYPDINCTCTPDWQGDQCGIGTANVYVCVYKHVIRMNSSNM